MTRQHGRCSFSVRYAEHAKPHVVVNGADVSNDVMELHVHEVPGQMRTATITVLIDSETIHKDGD